MYWHGCMVSSLKLLSDLVWKYLLKMLNLKLKRWIRDFDSFRFSCIYIDYRNTINVLRRKHCLQLHMPMNDAAGYCWRPQIFSWSYNISPPQLREHNVKQETTLKPKETIFNGTYLYCGFVVSRRRFAWMKIEYTRFSTMFETAVTVLNWNE